MTKTMNTNLKFRTKFEKLIENDEERQVFMAAFNKFCSFDPEDACDILWRLTYLSEDNFSISLELQKLGLNPEIISFEKISSLRNELRYQYELQDPTFLEVEVQENCEEAFDALSKKADPIVAAVVYNHCFASQYIDTEDANRILWLLNNDQENNFFGGIRSLFFGKDEANYLKPFHLLIHNLFNAIYEVHHKKNTPFQMLSNQLEDAGINLPENADSDLPFVWDYVENETTVVAPEDVWNNAPESVPTDSNSKFKELTPKNVWESQDVFSSFMASLSQLRELGFDLNQVIAKEEAIINLLKAAEALNN